MYCYIAHKKDLPRREGIVYNKKEKRLEGDSSEILPF